MKFICTLVAFSIFLMNAATAETLKLSAVITNEDLAEEAISLLHCLAEKTDSEWDYSGEISGAHWLKVKETGNSLQGLYHREEKELPFSLKTGEAEKICATLLPSSTEPEILNLAPVPPRLGDFPAEVQVREKVWPWAVGAVAVVAAGFFIWKASGPEHRALLMQ